MATPNIKVATQKSHDVLPTVTHDERARQLFAKDFRKYILYDVPKHTRKIYEYEVKPKLTATAPTPPLDHQVVQDAMWAQGFIRAAQSLQRISQEMLWNSVVPNVARQADHINRTTQALATQALGTLELNPNVGVPEYLTRVDIHCMPGNYHAEFTDDDATQGAIFDRGSYLYALGAAGELNDATGRLLVSQLQSQFPDLQPQRILDLGSTIGHNTLPLCDGYPAAEVYATDVAAPMLRYGHARASALGKRVHFSQRDARQTGYPDAHFDLVTSIILFHEVHPDEIISIFREARRVLKPGGVMAHIDIPNYFNYPDPLLISLVHADTFHNNEPYWGNYHRLDLEALMVEAGFERENCFRGVAMMDRFPWAWFGAVKT